MKMKTTPEQKLEKRLKEIQEQHDAIENLKSEVIKFFLPYFKPILDFFSKKGPDENN